MFAAADLFRYYRLPLDLAELVVVGERCHIKPLLPLFMGDGHFFILALSQNQVRLLEGTRHSVDEIDLDEAKSRVLRYFRQVNEGLVQVFRDERAPLVLAGVDYLLPLYKEANTYSHLLEQGLTGNPEALTPAELHRRAWEIV